MSAGNKQRSSSADGRARLTDEELAARIPALHSELERIERELTGVAKREAIWSAFRWARSLDLQPLPTQVEQPNPEGDASIGPRRFQVCVSTGRASRVLLVTGVAITALGASAALLLDGITASSALVLVGLVAATFGMLGVLSRGR